MPNASKGEPLIVDLAHCSVGLLMAPQVGFTTWSEPVKPLRENCKGYLEQDAWQRVELIQIRADGTEFV